MRLWLLQNMRQTSGGADVHDVVISLSMGSVILAVRVTSDSAAGAAAVETFITTTPLAAWFDGTVNILSVTPPETTPELYIAPSPPPASPSSVCSEACAAEFHVCCKEGPGYAACTTELADPSHFRLGVVCGGGCTFTPAMTALSGTDHPCTPACEAEYITCVQHGPGAAVCTQELRTSADPLGPLCQPTCVFTTTMNQAQPEHPPPAPPTVAGTCGPTCAIEFEHCCTHGPGYVACVSELRASTGPLGATCPNPTCRLTGAMNRLNHGGCTKSCENEFIICVAEGPGYATCLKELKFGLSPLASASDPCLTGCTPTATMTALAHGASGGACSSACADEFVLCATDGPGFDMCIIELRQTLGRIGEACADPSCTLTSAMQAQEAGAHVCSAACADEFVNHCVPHHGGANAGGCAACRQEIDEGESGSPLGEVCHVGCTSSNKMSTMCPA